MDKTIDEITFLRGQIKNLEKEIVFTRRGNVLLLRRNEALNEYIDKMEKDALSLCNQRAE